MAKLKSGLWPAFLLLVLAGCVPPQSQIALPGAPPGNQLAFSDLPGWAQDNTSDALAAFVLGCQTILRMPPDQPLGGGGMAQEAAGQAGRWQASCTAAQVIPPGDDAAARNFFETNFTLYAAPGQAVITGYFEPEYPGAKNLSPGYNVPLYDKPADETLAVQPRQAIDDNVLYRRAPVTAYLSSPVDAFMLQIQGSGRILLPNGNTLRVGYDGDNNQPYTPIGRLLVQNGDLQPNDVSFQTISAWLKDNPVQARAFMEQNANYAYLRPLGPLPDNEGAPGALGVPLTAGRSIAMDKEVVPLGTPVFVTTTDPITNTPIQRLTITQDRSGGTQGANQADLFFGAGPDAEATAGSMRAPGQLYILLPNPSAAQPSQ
jgi:membrane-bound lytic murein transglycosylase A